MPGTTGYLKILSTIGAVIPTGFQTIFAETPGIRYSSVFLCGVAINLGVALLSTVSASAEAWSKKSENLAESTTHHISTSDDRHDLEVPRPIPHVSSMTDTARTKDTTATDVISMGCRLNGYESEQIQAMAAKADLTDAVIINTCAVTNEAVRQTRQKIRQVSRETPQKKIIVTGCAAQIDPASFEAMPEVASVIGNDEKMRSATWQNFGTAAEPIHAVRDIMTVTELQRTGLPVTAQNRTRAYIQIQNGCDHRCTFCIIPYGRGNSRSVPVEDVITEIRDLVEHGTKEVVLTGVDITSYGPDLPGTPSLGILVKRILTDLPALPRLRLSSIDGAEIDDQLFDLITEEERIAPHLHLSLQAGDDMILKRMKRRHTRAQAVDFCQEIRDRRPEVAFGADIIAGFPTETEKMFENSVSLVTECDLAYLHVFPFSPREGTPAARMPQLDRQTVKDRATRLRAAGDAALERHLDRMIGQTLDVLTEKPSAADLAKKTGRGRLANFAEVTFDASANIGLLEPGQTAPMYLTSHDGRTLQASFEQGNQA